MRIIAGELKGRRLKTPKWDGTPTDVGQAARDAVQRRCAARRGCARARSLRGHRRDRNRGDQPGCGACGVRRRRSARVDADRGKPASLRRHGPLCYYPNAAITAGRIDRSRRAGSALRRTRSDGRDCRSRAPDCARWVACARTRAPPSGAGAGRTIADVAGLGVRRQRAGVLFRSRGAARGMGPRN